MRIAVLSDIHGNLDGLEAVVEDMRDRGIDHVVNLGDSLAGPLLPKETARFLMAQNWTQIAGNHERQMLALSPGSGPLDTYAHAQLDQTELDWLASLPAQATIDGEVLLCHGTPNSDLVALLEVADRPASRDAIATHLAGVTASVILCGHSHVARCLRVDTRLVVNPGSVGLPAYSDVYPIPHSIEAGSPDARYAIVEKRAAGWQAALISVPYDSSRMTRLARSRAFPEWASALTTGYLP